MAGLSRGDLCFVNLNPTKGHEESGKRACLIISMDEFNNGPAGLITVVPLTHTDRGIEWHVKVTRDDSTGIDKTSYILCDQIRTVSKDRIICGTGGVSQKIVKLVEERIRILLGL